MRPRRTSLRSNGSWEGEGLVVTVHGHVVPVHVTAGTSFGEVIVERHGDLAVHAGAPSWAIEPRRMFAADMSVHRQGDGPA